MDDLDAMLDSAAAETIPTVLNVDSMVRYAVFRMETVDFWGDSCAYEALEACSGCFICLLWVRGVFFWVGVLCVSVVHVDSGRGTGEKRSTVFPFFDLDVTLFCVAHLPHSQHHMSGKKETPKPHVLTLSLFHSYVHIFLSILIPTLPFFHPSYLHHINHLIIAEGEEHNE